MSAYSERARALGWRGDNAEPVTEAQVMEGGGHMVRVTTSNHPAAVSVGASMMVTINVHVFGSEARAKVFAAEAERRALSARQYPGVTVLVELLEGQGAKEAA